MNITYTKQGDYYCPNIVLADKTHNRILAERKQVQRQEKYEQRQWKLMVRRAIKDQHEQERMNAPMEEPYAPDYIANNAKHPFSGGAMCPR
ncbi:MAG: TnpV protein [Lachnospiraceae bacterium]|nr:TnpV protein [Lachnospiraceae bacterium]